MKNNYYVYIYLDPRKYGIFKYNKYEFEYEPFYVGKGNYKRWKNIANRNKYFLNKINKIKNDGLYPLIIKLKENLREEDSFILETKLINLIGRKDLDKGPLINLTNGGEGSSGYIHTEETLEKIRKDFQDIKKEFEKRGYILLTKEEEYKNAHQKLKYIHLKCEKKHSISWLHFKNNHGCSICGNERSMKKRRKNFKEIKMESEKRGYILLTKEEEYKNAFQKLKYRCKKEHEFLMRRNDIQQGHNCPICFNESKSDKMKGKNSILLIQDVIQIKLLLKENNLLQKEIADIFEISPVTISKIKKNNCWKYVNI